MLTDKLHIEDCKDEEKINFFGEVSRNFIIQISNKYAQFKTYYASFKILEILNSKCCNISKGEKDYIFSCFELQNNNNKNIFAIITDGSYSILRFTINIISRIEKVKLNTEKKIREFIEENINNNRKILMDLMLFNFLYWKPRR